MRGMNILTTRKSKSKEEKYDLLKQELHARNSYPAHGKNWLGACDRTWRQNLGAVLCRDNRRKTGRNQPRCRRTKIDGVKEKPGQRDSRSGEEQNNTSNKSKQIFSLNFKQDSYPKI
jgi:hypothetical protein